MCNNHMSGIRSYVVLVCIGCQEDVVVEDEVKWGEEKVVMVEVKEGKCGWQ